MIVKINGVTYRLKFEYDTCLDRTATQVTDLTRAVLYEESKYAPCTYANAYRNPKDHPNRDIGRRVALTKLLAKVFPTPKESEEVTNAEQMYESLMGRMHAIKEAKAIRTKFWKVYNHRYGFPGEKLKRKLFKRLLKEQ